MNKRIKELVEQSGIQEDLVDHLKDEVEVLTYIARPQDIERFAESIVRECIERVRSQCIHVRDSTIEGRPNPFFPDLRVRTEREQGIVECGIKSVVEQVWCGKDANCTLPGVEQ